MTEKLFWKDPYLTHFTARVMGQVQLEGSTGVELDQTCFYATSGGQPNDLGTLNGAAVKDVRFQSERLLHVLSEPLQTENVVGMIDWKRRFDHMQQHSGQHILSAAFYKLFGAETSSFHLGTESCSIELNQPSLNETQLRHAQTVTNEVISSATPVSVFFLDPAKAQQVALRKQPDVGENLRIIQIGEFDLSPCSGTHVRNAAEVGMVFVTGSEKIANGIRVSFLCGLRVIRQYQEDLSVLKNLSKLLTTSFELLPESVKNLQLQAKDLRKENEQFRQAALKDEATQLLQATAEWKGQKLMISAWERPYSEVRFLAQKLLEHPGIVGALASISDRRIVFFRNRDCAVEIRPVFQNFLDKWGIKGGGPPHFMEAGGFETQPDFEVRLRSLFG